MLSINHNFNIMYIKNHKCASCFITHFLNKNYGFSTYYIKEIINYNDKTMIEYGYTRYIFYNKKLLNLCDISDIKQYYIFSFVRNPYIRFISSFLFLLSIPTTTKINAPDNFILKLSLWEIIQQRDYLSQLAYSHMFHTQCKNLDIENVKYDFIGKCEDNVQNQLCEIMKKWKEIPKYIIPITHKVKVNFTIKENPFYEYYNNNIFEFVNSWFDCDFKKFGYRKCSNYSDFLLTFSG